MEYFRNGSTHARSLDAKKARLTYVGFTGSKFLPVTVQGIFFVRSLYLAVFLNRFVIKNIRAFITIKMLSFLRIGYIFLFCMIRFKFADSNSVYIASVSFSAECIRMHKTKNRELSRSTYQQRYGPLSFLNLPVQLNFMLWYPTIGDCARLV